MSSKPTGPHACHFIPGVVASSSEDAPLAGKLLEQRPLDEGQVQEVFEGWFDGDTLGEVLDLVGLFVVDDPHETAAMLRDAGVNAAPVHGLGHLNHLASMTGTAPVKAGAQRVPDRKADPNRIVALIDTGVTEGIPEWLASHLVYERPDIEVLAGTRAVSHGTFVAGLIRQIAPEHTIHLARARKVPIDQLGVVGESRHAKTGENPTTELHVLEAVVRLVRRLKGKSESQVEALNMSLGGVVCDTDDPVLVVLETAIDLWRRNFPRCTQMFAAGGNSPDPRPVYPGAFNYVRAVGAGSKGGNQIVWDKYGTGAAKDRPISPAPKRSWITDVAPGSKLLGPSGKAPDSWVSWSGSSFATAVATAMYVTRGAMEVENGLVYWPNRQIRYGDVPGLRSL